MNDLPPGFIVDTAWLNKRWIDSKSIQNYVHQGWIERIVRGVYRRPLQNGASSDRLSWQVVLLSLQQLMGYSVHLGGRNALDYAIHPHSARQRKEGQKVHIYGDVPSWVNRLPMSDQLIMHKLTLFAGAPAGIVNEFLLTYNKEWAAEVWRWPLKISSPERAILELMAELRGGSVFEYVEMYFQSLQSLRPELLLKLLRACQSVKVRRLFFAYADLYQHSWHKEMDSNQIDFGSGARTLVPGGEFHPAYQISLPETFFDTSYEDENIF